MIKIFEIGFDCATFFKSLDSVVSVMWFRVYESKSTIILSMSTSQRNKLISLQLRSIFGSSVTDPGSGCICNFM